MNGKSPEHELTAWLRVNKFGSDFDRKSFFKAQEIKAQQLREADPDLDWLFSRKDASQRNVDPGGVLLRNGLPVPTLEFRGQIREGSQERVDKALVKDDQIYLLRGDYPGLMTRGFYAYIYMRWNMNIDQFLLADKDLPPSAHFSFHPKTTLEQYMWQHSNGGYEFVSATPSHETARKHPEYRHNSGSVYVLKMPLERVILNYASVVTDSWREAEYLIPDYVLPEQIVAELDPKSHPYIDVREFIQ